jgi:hypothetical protein
MNRIVPKVSSIWARSLKVCWANKIICFGIVSVISQAFLYPLATRAQGAGLSTEKEKAAGYKVSAGKHIGRGDGLSNAASIRPMQSSLENAAQIGPISTRSSFVAKWNRVTGATGYRVDISTNASFSNYMSGYEDLDVGNVTSRTVSGLKPGTTYYYRVRAYNTLSQGVASDTMSITTAAGSGLIINATFDVSILNDPQSAAIQAMINQAIAIYESLFSDPISVSILFRYSTTAPDGIPLGPGDLAQSNFVVYGIPWNTYIAALQIDATTSNDTTANASLPLNPLTTNILPSSAGGRAVTLDTLGVMCADGTFNCGNGTFDGIVTLNSAAPFQFTRPPSASSFDGLTATEHEIDEVLGFGSYLNAGGSDLRPQDLFSWSSPGNRNLSSVGSRYFSIDSGNTDIVDFNQDPSGDFGDWLSDSCPQVTPHVQNAFGCPGQFSDVAATSPEGINLDVIGYDLVSSPTPTPTPHPYGVITSPPPGSTLPSSTVTFSWTPGTAATAYWLTIGDETVGEPGGFNILNSGQTGGHSWTVINLPTDGRTIYVRLWSFVNGSWFTPPQDYTYTAQAVAVSTPIIASDAGTFRGSVLLNIATATPGATIFYTIDGSNPATSSNVFTGPFRLTGNGGVTLKAIATKTDVPNSDIATASFTIRQTRHHHRHRRR